MLKPAELEKISIIIPCYNEEKSIEHLTERLKQLETIIPWEKYTYELVFIDDGSTDNTNNLLRTTYENKPEIKIITHETNLGYGNALKTGFKFASGSYIVCYDGDCTTPIEDIEPMLGLMKDNVDIVSASAFHPSGNAGRVLWYRLVFSKTLILLYKLVLGKKARAITSFTLSFRIYRKNIIDNIDFKSGNFLAASEILILALLKGYRVVEYPTTLIDREHGESKMKIISTIVAHIRFILKLGLGKVIKNN